MAMKNLSPETLSEMLIIIREARNDLKKWREEDEAKMRSKEDLSIKSSANQKLFSSVAMTSSHKMLARNAPVGREISRNFENPLRNFVEHVVGEKQHEVSMVENPKMEWYSGGFGLLKQAPLSTSTVTSSLPKKPPDPPNVTHGKSRNKGTIFPKYSCEEMYERMDMGLCVFCEEVDIPGHNLKHKGVTILVTESDDEPIVEDTCDESYEPVTETVTKHDSLSKSLECFTSVLQIVDAAGQREHVSESVVQEEMSLCLGEKIKHMMGKQSQKAERIWEPGGLPTEAAQWYWPEKWQSLWFSAATSEKMAERVWEPGGLPAKEIHKHWTKKLCNQDDVLQLIPKLNMTELGFRSKMDSELKLFIGMSFHNMKPKAGVETQDWLEIQAGKHTLTGSNVTKSKMRMMSASKGLRQLAVSDMKYELRAVIMGEASYFQEPRTAGLEITSPQVSHAITVIVENILVKKLCHQGYCFLMFLVQDHIIEALFSHFLACGILLVSYSNQQPLLVSYSRQCHEIIYSYSSDENMSFAITRRWLSVVHLLWTAVSWNRKPRKKEDESRLSWDALFVRYKELKHFTQKLCEDLIQAGYEWLFSNYSCHKANTVKELATTDVRVRRLWKTITDVTVALFSGCGITKNFTEYINWSEQGMQDHTGFSQFLFNTEMFQVKHKWRDKPFPVVSELELKVGAALETRNEDVLSCYTIGQARDEVVSCHVEVRRTIEMSQSAAWIFKYNDKRQKRDRNETQQHALKIKLGQSKYCREVQKMALQVLIILEDKDVLNKGVLLQDKPVILLV